MPNAQKSPITQKIPISEIKDGAFLLKDGGLRGVLMTTSLNFALKSTEEQDAITYRYQDFLNSLDFHLQILVVTRKFDVTHYLEMLEQKRNEQDNELLKIQISEYTDFIKGLSQVVNIMSTFFYLIVPFAQTEEQKAKGIVQQAKTFFKKQTAKEKDKTFEQMRLGLTQRMDYIASGLSAMGLKAVALGDEELLELAYRMYNPEAREKPKLET